MTQAAGSGHPDRRATTIDATFGEGLCIRLVDAPAAVGRQLATELGAVEGPPGEPLLTVRFVAPRDRRGLTMLGQTSNAFAFDAEHFYVVGGRGHLTRLDLASLETAEIEIERGETTIPLLMPLLAVRLAATGRVLLHAASFLDRGRAVVVTGWQSGGKSELLFAFMERGATYLADEWTVVRSDGSIEGIASDVHLWDWQLRALPRLAARVPAAERRRISALHVAGGVVRPLRSRGRSGSVRRSLADLEGWLEHAGRVRMAPDLLFGDRVHRGPVPFGDLVLASVAGETVSVRDIDGGEIARRIGASLEYERRDLLWTYAQYRYAFPDRTGNVIERAAERERSILEAAFAGVRAHHVRHPYPPSFDELYEVTAPALHAIDA